MLRHFHRQTRFYSVILFMTRCHGTGAANNLETSVVPDQTNSRNIAINISTLSTVMITVTGTHVLH